MGDRLDEAKGRVKEAAGVLANDEALEREGQRDQAGATIKRAVREAADATKDAVDRVVDSAKRVVDGDR